MIFPHSDLGTCSFMYIVYTFLVLKARHLGGSAFCNFYRLGVPEQASGGIAVGFGIVVEDKPSELSCML